MSEHDLGTVNVIHPERHFRASAVVRDIVIGMADGLTVPFALAAGISGAVSGLEHGSSLVVTAGLAEIAAGAIAMGLGGYLAARSEHDHYFSERQREEEEIIQKPSHERREIVEIMSVYGVSEDECAPLIRALERRPQAWRDFMMRFELGLEEPDPRRATHSALTIGLSYVAGGVIPLAPYMLTHSVQNALGLSIGVTLASLFGFGWIKGRFASTSPWRSAAQTLLIGGFAAAVAYSLARALT